MRHFSRLAFMVLLFVLLAVVGIVTAQDMPGEIVISNLDSPRGLAFDDEGNLFIADSGNGGDQSFTITVDGAEITSTVGLSGRVVSVAPDGTATDVLLGLPSYLVSPQRSDGLYRVIPNGDSLWLVFSGSGKTTSGTYWRNSIVELDATTLATRRVINLDEFEAANDPDGSGFDTNVADIAWGPDGVAYIVDAAGNDLLSWTEDDGLQVVTAWADNPVPTAVEVADNGDLYVSFLATGMESEAAVIERWSDGALVETFTGLTAVTDIVLDGADLYAVEFVNYVEDEAGPGRVVKVTADGLTTVAENLVAPFAIAKGPDDALYVTYGAVAFVEGLTGGVVRIDLLEAEMNASDSQLESGVDVVLAGNVENGREIFRSGINDAQRCANCHRVTTRGFAVDAGPNLEAISEKVEDRIEGMTAEEYLRDSIINPQNYVVEGDYLNPMPDDYAVLLTEQEIEDLVAYMMQLTSS